MKKYDLYSKRDPAKNFSPLPNEVFYLGLSYGAIAVYGYLMHIEDRKTFQSYAGYNTIGRAVKMSSNTVRKYVLELEEKHLIRTEPETDASATEHCATTSALFKRQWITTMSVNSVSWSWIQNGRERRPDCRGCARLRSRPCRLGILQHPQQWNAACRGCAARCAKWVASAIFKTVR